MTTNRRTTPRLRQRLPGAGIALAALVALTGSTDTALAQDNRQGSGAVDQQAVDKQAIERLRRDQDDILRRAERLERLMKRLLTRYQRENKQEQVQYLKEGLKHLDESGILRDVASIRENIETTAFTEALRKQKDVVNDLERLLNILLDRKSIENIDEEVQKVSEQVATAAELERRQRELIEAARDTMTSELSEAEQQLANQLQDLRDAEQREADRNSQQAGMRRPFLESALSRIKSLLNNQKQLEDGLEDEASGRTPEAKTQSFDLGDLNQKVRELQRELRNQKQQQKLGKAGKDLQAAAAANDEQALQQARDLLDRLLEMAPTLPKSQGEFKERDGEWQKIRKEGRAAPEASSQAGKEALDEVGKAAEEHANKRNDEATAVNSENSEKLTAAAKQLAARLKDTADKPTEAQKGKQSADAVAEAAKQLEEAKAAVDKGDTDKANEMVNKALSSLDKARQRHRAENPDAARNAGKMAAEASAAARELANAPIQEDAEKQAGEELANAAKALRDVSKKVEEARNQSDKGNSQEKQAEAGKAAQQSRQSLEDAKQAIEKALREAAANNQQELQAAAERQQQLSQQVDQAKQQMQQAAKNGDINQKQQKAAEQALNQAQQSMQKAQQQLQKGQQSSASQQQQKAAEQMQKAMDALQENRELSQEQKDQLAQQAKQQEQLTEDIIRLAEELKKRRNKDAERAAEEAADASRKAQRAMEQGDTEETQKQQEKAREKLEEATDKLQEEKDRYQDLRQEELLFKMKEELTAFLDKQRPITETVKQVQKVSGTGRLSRPARKRVNGLGEEEEALAGKIQFLVNALTDEGNLVYRSVLSANLEDLREVARRLAGRAPDVGSFTTLLQDDVERRTVQLLDALEKELKRSDEERKQQQQQQQQDQQSKNKFNQQRQKLVSLIAELEMLKNLDVDTKEAAENLRTFVEVRADETISDAEVAMIQRLAHRHNEITKLFEKIKAGVEEALNQQNGEEEGGDGR